MQHGHQGGQGYGAGYPGQNPYGYAGAPGMPGQPTMGGYPGMPGQPAMGGYPGMPGQPGMMGQPMPGYPGMPGQSGYPGMPAQPGYPGMPGQGIPNAGFMAQPFGLNMTQIKNLKSVFKNFDRNGNGKIEFNELFPLLQTLYSMFNLPPPSPQMVMPLLQKYGIMSGQGLPKKVIKSLVMELSGLGTFDQFTAHKK